uniref:Acylglycerol kinase, mitochondrial n=1 Tax=Microcebus murinus TaxID=30608 RepID=A0A8C5XPN9_MICMU
MTVFFKALRNHWKKTTAGLCLLPWGGHWLYGNTDGLLRSAACQGAQVFGNQLIPPNAQVKKQLPAACKGKARTLFETNAALIWHLSGMDVTVIKTDYEGQAKKLLELMESTDVITVAGGEGSLQEVVTGVLRRTDEATFSKIPIGFIPLGQTSSLRTTCVCNDWPSMGSFRDAGVKVSNYWHPGPLKTKAAHFFSTLKEWPQIHQASISYTGPTERSPSEPEETSPRPSLYRRIL